MKILMPSNPLSARDRPVLRNPEAIFDLLSGAEDRYL